MSRRVLAVARYFDRFVHADGFVITSRPKSICARMSPTAGGFGEEFGW